MEPTPVAMSQRFVVVCMLRSFGNTSIPDSHSLALQGTGVGELRNPSDPESYGLDAENNHSADSFLAANANNKGGPSDENGRGRVEIGGGGGGKSLVKRFKFGVSGGDDAARLPPWEAILWQGRLYVNVTMQQLSEGSKEAFVELLEYAEERLGCSHVVVCLDRQLKEMKVVVRNFLFLGFRPLAPGHEFLPKNPNLVSMQLQLHCTHICI